MTARGDQQVEHLTDVWRTKDRLRIDDDTITRLCDSARRDPAIANVMAELQPDEPGNGSIWATGKALHDGTSVLLKLGARKDEREWMVSLHGSTNELVPRVFGSGELSGVGWLVLEQCDFRLDRSSAAHAEAVVRSAARAQQAATKVSASTTTMDAGWLREYLEVAQSQDCPGDVERALAGLDKSWDFVTDRCDVTVNHGDLHFSNVVLRTVTGSPLLIDPMPITTVWAWDAAYFEVASGHEGMIPRFERARRALGSPATADLMRVERLLLGWAAACWWRMSPWRHENVLWRAKVEQMVQALGW